MTSTTEDTETGPKARVNPVPTSTTDGIQESGVSSTSTKTWVYADRAVGIDN